MKRILLVFGIVVLVLIAGCSKDAAGPTATLTIINNSTYTINEFYCSLSSDPNFGPDRLSGTIASGESQSFTIPAGTVDTAADEITFTVFWLAMNQVALANGFYDWTLVDGDAIAY